MKKDIAEFKGNQLPAISEELNQDFETTSSNIESLIRQGNEGLELALGILKATEATPRTVETFSTLLRTVADLNMKYLEVKKSKEDRTSGNSDRNHEFPEAKIVHQNQYVFNGSTDDLSKLVAEISTKKK
ncbi:MAG: hypothetical protein PHG08_00610 [Bacilli bacterium]|nr:hypothetical protein [Bacilli bacterium]